MVNLEILSTLFDFSVPIFSVFFLSAIAICILTVAIGKYGKPNQKTQSYVKPVHSQYQFTNFKGLGDEPFWSGTLLERVDDYTAPRYVYENSVETTELDKSQGRIIGYRISPTLVIHCMIASNHCCNRHAAIAFRTKYGGNFLNTADVETLQKNWNAVSQMRLKAGDTMLPEGWFWFMSKHLIPIHFRGIRTAPPENCNVIMKR